jgi:hypothetical protein
MFVAILFASFTNYYSSRLDDLFSRPLCEFCVSGRRCYIHVGAIGFEVDDLSAAIGQSDAVRSSNESLVIAGLLVSVVVVSRLIFNRPV